MSMRSQNIRGFALVEMMVALMIFSIVGVVAITALIRIVDANKKSQTIQDAVVGMSFTMESMTRELRTGAAYYCKAVGVGLDLTLPAGNQLTSRDVSACTNADGNSGIGVGFAFLSSRTDGSGRRLINAYEVVPNVTAGVPDGTFSFKKAIQLAYGDALTFTPVLDNGSVTLIDYYLQIRDAEYPLLFIKLEGTAGTKESIKTYFMIQTAASPRLP